jgi:hypothetical protein
MHGNATLFASDESCSVVRPGLLGYLSRENGDGKADTSASDKFVDLFRRIVVEKRKETLQTHG